jgi:hypothetical protein
MKRCWYFKAIVINCFLENEKSTGYCFLIYRNRIQILSNSQAILPLPQNKNKNSHLHSENCAVLEKIRASPVASPTPSLKGIWGAYDKKRFPVAFSKDFFFVRRAPIRYLAPRARPRPTWDTPGTPDAPKSEAGSGVADPSAAH